MKPATRKILLTKTGDMDKRYIKAFNSCEWIEKTRRVYPVRYADENNNPSSTIDLRLYILAVLKRERLRFTQGMDLKRAPRGGKVGIYYTLTPQGWETLQTIKLWQNN